MYTQESISRRHIVQMNKNQIIPILIGCLLVAAVLAIPPWNDVCSFQTADNLKTYRAAGFRPWWNIDHRTQMGENSIQYMEINWAIWFLELGAAMAITTSALIVSRRQQ